MIGTTNAVGSGAALKATDAILRVIAPAGSMVTISKGAVSKSDLGHENHDDATLYDYYFIIHASQFDSVNPWTVTATLGTQSISETVIINSADEYDVVISYTLWLVQNGVLRYGDFTGLALKSSSDGSASSTAPTISSGSGYISMGWTSGASSSANAGGGIGYFSSHKIDLSKYNTCHVDGTLKNGTGYTTNNSFQAWTAIGSYQSQNRLIAEPISTSVSSDSFVSYNKNIDISSLVDMAYVGFNGYHGTSNYTMLRIANLYLEA